MCVLFVCAVRVCLLACVCGWSLVVILQGGLFASFMWCSVVYALDVWLLLVFGRFVVGAWVFC